MVLYHLEPLKVPEFPSQIPQHQSSLFQSGPGMQSATPRGSGATWDDKLSGQVLCDSSLAFVTSPHPLSLSRISSSRSSLSFTSGRGGQREEPREGLDVKGGP